MTKQLLITLAVLLLPFTMVSQNFYFPPTTGSAWDTVSPASLGWCTDSIPPLLQMLEESNTKAFVVLKDGKIVIEAYFDNFSRDSAWYWASAGKSLTAFLVGLAQEQGHLNIHDKTSDYLGQGWTAAPQAKEDSITIWHQLTMTTGLNDGLPSQDCTIDTCLQYLTDAGNRWAYHNGPYTLLDSVVEAATGQTMNQYHTQQIKLKTGITGAYFPVNYNNVYFSTARSMARFGLLALNKGKWNQTVVMADTNYFNAMTNTSQNLNKGYGYLWWLNGKDNYMLPTSQFVFNGYLAPNAPADMFAALGRDGQIINVAPSLGLVVVRMGESPGPVYLVPNAYNDSIWQRLMPVLNCSATNTLSTITVAKPGLYPNPNNGTFTILWPHATGGQFTLFNLLGEKLLQETLVKESTTIEVSQLNKGIYLFQLTHQAGMFSGKVFIE